jgi:hypothetical protein
MPISRLVLATAAAVLASEAMAQDAGFPPRREGLWEVITITEKPDKVPKVTARMCVDRATDADLMGYGLKMSKDTCPRYETSRKGQTWVIDSQCKVGPVTTTGKAQVSGDFQANVKVRMDGTTEGMPGTNGPQPLRMTQTARWVAEACDGLKPGDVLLDGGIKVNVKQLKQLQKLLPGLLR